ncbi:hypothetical protein TanjilG_03787 [Lupinus angustifolius]|uniref:Uncharacterized protein n=1 Tax=Lupinus angustifolius TaxID=3871 RepID=A0A1J7GUQ7_LUPAN|nr:PREDICTED: uncharacterized protein LOC109331900 [Lupinus angustifolius]OIV93824.1 hypothetical protein TanjilG_03787 [Lupinus angustifolius]
MENVCDVSQLDADVLLPPRKRLLAGLKKRSSDGDATAFLSPVAVCCVTDVAYPSSVSFSSEFETRLKHLLSYRSNNPNLTPEELVEASKAVAISATKAAKAARAAAEEKSAIAAKAVAAAKSALDLAASFSEEAVTKKRNLKRSKSKKHLPVQLLYKKNRPIGNCRTDEELAHTLHRAINSSPRISKNSPNSNSKGSKHKKLKSSSSFKIIEASDAGVAFGQDHLSLNNGHTLVGKIDSDGSNKKGFKYDISSQMEIDNGKAESSQSKEKNYEDLSPIGKKRGRAKLKKSPLSICTSKDKARPKEGIRARSSLLTEMNTGNHSANNIPLFPVEPSSDRMKPIEATPMWKCKELKAPPPTCIKQNKSVQS